MGELARAEEDCMQRLDDVEERFASLTREMGVLGVRRGLRRMRGALLRRDLRARAFVWKSRSMWLERLERLERRRRREARRMPTSSSRRIALHLERQWMIFYAMKRAMTRHHEIYSSVGSLSTLMRRGLLRR